MEKQVKHLKMEELNIDELSQVIENQKAHIIGETNLMTRNRMTRGLLSMYERFYNLSTQNDRNINFIKAVNNGGGQDGQEI